jgi:hypothetical protein
MMLRRVAKPWVPHAYQKKAIKFLLSHGAAGLWLDPEYVRIAKDRIRRSK